MPTPRDKLIAQWRHKLHAAEEISCTSPHAAWLARMQIRLYRFLLACYAKSEWNTTPRPMESPACAVFDAPAAAFLHGKPAKTSGKIQAVLKAVHAAQDHPPHGPFAAGIDRLDQEGECLVVGRGTGRPVPSLAGQLWSIVFAVLAGPVLAGIVVELMRAHYSDDLPTLYRYMAFFGVWTGAIVFATAWHVARALRNQV